MHKQRLTMLTGSLGLVAWGGLVPAQALPSYTPIVLNNPTSQELNGFGFSVAGVGDVSGDGIPDLLVGAYLQDVGGNIAQGQAFVFSGADRSLIHTLNDPMSQEYAYFGNSVAGVRDVNGDGIPDLLVGASLQNVGDKRDQGQAFVFSGATGQRLLTLNNPTPQAYALFGISVVGMGDVSGDGVPDILVGALEQDVGGRQDQGQAFVFSGATGQRLLTLNNPTPQAYALFGYPVAGVGDVSGDGVPDILVGVNSQTVGGNVAQGQAFVFSGTTGQRLYTLNTPTPQEGAYFGDSVAGVGDVNSDGVPDLLVGAPGQGQAFVFSGADRSLIHTLNDPTSQDAAFGDSVAGVGDVNSDGVPDLLVGTFRENVGGNHGQAFVFSGAEGKWLLTLNTPTPQTSIAGVGDVNGDEVPDFLVGAPDRDQAFLFVSGPPLAPRWVAMNILPKQINGQTQDVLPVAILTTPKFDAAQVDPLSVRLGPGKAQEIHRQGHFRDVDRDGDRDLVLHFRTQAVGLGCGEQAVKLTGQTVVGQPIQGVDRLVVVGCQ